MDGQDNDCNMLVDGDDPACQSTGGGDDTPVPPMQIVEMVCCAYRPAYGSTRCSILCASAAECGAGKFVPIYPVRQMAAIAASPLRRETVHWALLGGGAIAPVGICSSECARVCAEMRMPVRERAPVFREEAWIPGSMESALRIPPFPGKREWSKLPAIGERSLFEWTL